MTVIMVNVYVKSQREIVHKRALPRVWPGLATPLHRKANAKPKGKDVLRAGPFGNLLKANQTTQTFCFAWWWGQELDSKPHRTLKQCSLFMGSRAGVRPGWHQEIFLLHEVANNYLKNCPNKAVLEYLLHSTPPSVCLLLKFYHKCKTHIPS